MIQLEISAMENEELTWTPLDEEIFATLTRMSPEKAPRPNGMTIFFYTSFWHIVGSDVIRTVKDFFLTDQMPPTMKHTFLALIPKVDHAYLVGQFRPINLCNVCYKLI